MEDREQTIIDCDGLLDGTGAPAMYDAAIRIDAECITAIGFGDQLGTLTPGKCADLIVVEGDPSQDITGLSRVRAVFQSGRRVG
jgi:hypothetical protein